MRLIATCVWSTRASPFCLQRTWLTFSGSWASSTGQVARSTLENVGRRVGSLPFAYPRRSPYASFLWWPPGTLAPLCLCGFRLQTMPPRCGWLPVPLLGALPDVGLSGYEARRLLATCRTIMPQEQRIQRASGFQVTGLSLIPPGHLEGVVFAAELNSLYDRAGARIHEVLAACRCWQQGEALWKNPLLMCPGPKQSSLTRSTDRSEHWRLGCCMLLRPHLRYRCHMPASSVGRSWGSGTPQVHARTAGCVLPESSDWFAVLLQSGRICGGTHGAGEWCVKRAIQAPESPQAPEPKRLQWSSDPRPRASLK